MIPGIGPEIAIQVLASLAHRSTSFQNFLCVTICDTTFYHLDKSDRALSVLAKSDRALSVLGKGERVLSVLGKGDKALSVLNKSDRALSVLGHHLLGSDSVLLSCYVSLQF